MPLPLCAPRGVLMARGVPLIAVPLEGMSLGARSSVVGLRGTATCGRLAGCLGSRGRIAFFVLAKALAAQLDRLWVHGLQLRVCRRAPDS